MTMFKEAADMHIAVPTARFAASARAFCSWAEGEVATPEVDLVAGHLLLARLYADALALSSDATWDGNAPEIAQSLWRARFDRFGSLPVGYYETAFNPLDVGTNETSLGDLSDDLSDIWRDVKQGLLLFDSGEVDGAVHTWYLYFSIHWGRHAASALHVLQCWMDQHRDFDKAG
jgi:hypothetical protein